MLTGTGAAPALAGGVTFKNVRLLAGSAVLNVESARVVYRAANPNAPSIDLVASGALLDEGFTFYVSGPIARPLRSFSGASALCETAIRAQLEPPAMKGDAEAGIASPRFSLRAPITLAGDFPSFDWTILTPPPPNPSTDSNVPDDAQVPAGGLAR